MAESVAKSWLKPTNELLDGYENTLGKLESAVEKEDMENVKNYSLQAAQYYLKLKDLDGVMGASKLSYFSEKDVQEYNDGVKEILNQFKKDIIRMKMIDLKITEKYTKYEKEKKDIHELVNAGYLPVSSHSKLIEEEIMPLTKKEQDEAEFKEAFGKDIFKKHEDTSDASYA
ncbi:MAG: hypothetical protein KAU95_02285 [Candidatus Aenigmarchaeota archaeon]|nr:hypothetical protein [Candidatus Aenigmarchaeota archaeon]